MDEHWLSVCGDGFAKTYKRVDNDLRQVSTEYTNQEGYQVLCHTWIPPPPEIAVGDDEEGDKPRKVPVKKKSKNGKDPLVVDCGCVYALDSGELLYVNIGEVGFSPHTMPCHFPMLVHCWA